jgi:general secretion pathway protein K
MNFSPSAPQNRGMAVIFVLIAITVLSIMAGLFAYSMKVETRLAANANDDEQLLWIGRAGVERARWILALEGQVPFTDKNQIWAGGPGEGPETNGPLNGISLDNFPVGDGTVSLKMTELESKINVNRADTPIIQQVLTTMGVDAATISVVSDSIQDWVDSDDATRPAGAESDYYQGLPHPYFAKNAPMDDISELLLVKGVTPEMFKGGGATNDADAAFQHHHLGFGNAPGDTPDYPFGLQDVFTPFSSGQVNLNTADENVLQCIPGMDTTSVENILKFRSGEGGGDGSSAFQSLGQLGSIVNPTALAQIQRYCTVRGSTYEVHAIAQIGDFKREYIAILFRNGPNVQVVSFHWN